MELQNLKELSDQQLKELFFSYVGKIEKEIEKPISDRQANLDYAKYRSNVFDIVMELENRYDNGTLMLQDEDGSYYPWDYFLP